MTESGLGNLFIVAAPSGGGKTSLVKALVNRVPGMEISISHTTREKRPKEKDGVDYYFVDEAKFVEMIGAGEFLEYAQVFHHYYGTSAGQIEQRLESGLDVVLDIDWQGALQIRHVFPEAVSVFVVPPSLDSLKQRLQARQQDDDHIIQTRMRRARDELSHYPEFDYLIVNDDFEKAAQDLVAIVSAFRLRLERQAARHAKLLSFLLASE